MGAQQHCTPPTVLLEFILLELSRPFHHKIVPISQGVKKFDAWAPNIFTPKVLRK